MQLLTWGNATFWALLFHAISWAAMSKYLLRRSKRVRLKWGKPLLSLKARHSSDSIATIVMASVLSSIYKESIHLSV